MLDSNVLQAFMQPDHAFHSAAFKAVLAAQKSASSMLLCPVVFVEMHSVPGLDAEEFTPFFADAGFEIDWDIPRDVWTLTGQAQAQYHERRRKAHAPQSRRLIADFIIGAHALARDAVLYSFDEGYETLYPSLEVRRS